jgi:endonuclease G, mitochondrial
MKIDRMTVAHGRRAMWQAARKYLYVPNVTCVDFGYPVRNGQLIEDELAVRIHVREHIPAFALQAAYDTGETVELPSEIDGFPVNKPEGVYTPDQFWVWGWGWGWQPPRPVNLRASRVDPMRGGISVSTATGRGGYGTLGGLVIDRRTGAEMILSNWHVLVGDWFVRPGQPILQPGRGDGGTAVDTVATLTREAMSVNLDAAVATLNGSRSLLNEQVDLEMAPGARKPALGMEVVKSGRRTGITYGLVTTLDGVTRIRLGGVERIVRGFFTIEPRQPLEQVSAAGDSGSFWLDRSSRQPVGLHFAGSSVPHRGLALDMPLVLDALAVDLP